MPQSSAPIVGVNLSDQDWRDSFGDEAGVLGDLDGSAYKVTLPSSSDVITVGSATQRSIARVAGFVHRIPTGETESLTIPPASGSARTDIIALRYDPAFTGAPGPVRLTRVAGSSLNLPTYDGAPPGIEDLPLWSITRQPGQAISQATVTRLFTRLAPSLDVPVGAPLPLSSPLATTAQQGNSEYRRILDSNGVPVWVQSGGTNETLQLSRTGQSFPNPAGYTKFSGWQVVSGHSGLTVNGDGTIRFDRAGRVAINSYVDSDASSAGWCAVRLAVPGGRFPGGYKYDLRGRSPNAPGAGRMMQPADWTGRVLANETTSLELAHALVSGGLNFANAFLSVEYLGP